MITQTGNLAHSQRVTISIVGWFFDFGDLRNFFGGWGLGVVCLYVLEGVVLFSYLLINSFLINWKS